MDISNNQQQLLAQLKPLLKAQGAKGIEAALAPGKQLSATVERVTEVTPELRGRLLQLLAESKAAQANPKSNTNQNAPNQTPLSQGNLPNNSSPATSTGSNNASALMNTAKNVLGSSSSLVNSLPQLLSAQLLNILEVKVLNTKLLMLSQLSVPAKTVLQFQVRQDGQLELLPKPNQKNAQNSAQERPSLTANNTTQAPLQNAKNQAQLYQSQAKNLLNQNLGAENSYSVASNSTTPNANPTKTQELHSALKTYLPLQQNLAKALNQLQQVVVASDSAKLEQSLPKLAPVFTELKSLLDRIPNAEQLNHSQKVKANIERSGFFLESSLKKLATDLQQNIGTKPAQTKALNTTGNIRANTSQSPANKPAPLEDLKTSLLKLMDELQQLLPKVPQNSPTPNKSQSVDSLIRSIFSFSQAGKTQTQEPNPQQLSQNIARNLHTTVFSAIARISLLQIQQLLQQDSGQLSQGFNLELPIKFGEQLLPLSLSVHEKWYEENEKDKNEKKKKDKKHEAKKRWHVFMEFDLDEYGSFASDITVQEASVKSTLWVQQKQLWQTTQAHLSELKTELEKNGIDVEEITLHQGKAPEKPLQVSQSLVDIRT